MGESAGAVAVGNLVNTSPDPLFRAAIEMSGSAVVNAPDFGGSNPDLAWTTLLEYLPSCGNLSEASILDCVRDVSADTLRNIIQDNGIVFSATVHNNVTSLERPDLAWAAGNVAKVPLLIGYTADDGSIFVDQPAALAVAANLTLLDALKTLGLPEAQATAMAAWYSSGSVYGAGINNTRDALYKLATDIVFGCSSGIVANLTSNLLDVPAWEYVYDAVVPSMSRVEGADLGAWHAGELALLFGTYVRENATEVDASVSRAFQKHFGDFIKDPFRGPGWAQWPQIGIMGIADGEAVTTTQAVMEYNPVCREYEKLWMATELTALAQAPLQKTQGVGNSGQEALASTSGGRFSLFRLTLIVGLILHVNGFLGSYDVSA
jgi:carboxylesterase type B